MQYNHEAETNVLGAMLLMPNLVTDIATVLEPADFYLPAHAAIYAAISAIDARGDQPDPILVSDELSKMGRLEDLEATGHGKNYIHSLTSAVPAASRGSQYAEIVKRLSVTRQLSTLSAQIRQMATDNTDPITIRAHIADTLDSIENAAIETDLVPVRLSLPDHYARLEQIAAGTVKPGHQSGFRDLDKLIHGFGDSFLYIIAARPAMGKTAFALNCAYNVAKTTRKPVAMFCLEQASIELNARLVSLTTKIPGPRLAVADLSKQEWELVAKAHAHLSELPIYLDDSPAMTLADIRAKCRRLKRKHGIGMVVIDYIQLVTPLKSLDKRDREVAEISKGLKALARELNCPVIALSQLNRQVEARQDKRPMMSDLRESGSIEQDADGILMLYRDEYYNRDSPDVGTAEVILAKYRHGPTGTAKLAFQDVCGRFADLAQRPTQPHWQDKD